MKVGNGKFLALQAILTAKGMRRVDLADAMCARSREEDYEGPPIDMTMSMLNFRFSGKTPWKVDEAILACDALEIDRNNVLTLFIDSPVAKVPPKHRPGRPRKAVSA